MKNPIKRVQGKAYFHYAERKDFGGRVADSTIAEAELPSEKRKVKSEKK